MKVTAEYRNQSRIFVDKKINKIKGLDSNFEWPTGWLKGIRESLGLSAKKLEARLKLPSGSVIRTEQREIDKTVTLATLESFANAMECKLVYALIPRGHQSLEEIVEKRAKKLAKAILADISHSMKIEAQEVDQKISEQEQTKLAMDLVEKLDRRLWEDDI